MADPAGLVVDPGNDDQAASWDGDAGAFWSAHAERLDRAVAAYHTRLLAAAGIGAADHVLDVGCGTGQVTRDAARAASTGSALGVDLSSQMVALARQLAKDQAIENATFEQADAQIHRFPSASFDLAVSRMGTMFFADPTAAFTNLARALRPEGRLAVLVWQGPEQNEWLRELTLALAGGRDLPEPSVGTPGPFAQADPDRVQAVLTASGFGPAIFTGLEEPMWFGPGVDDAYTFVLGLMGWMLQGAEDRVREQAMRDLRDCLSAHATDSGVVFGSAAWLVQASRV
jgi:SAM-dependent methyltransferase